MKAGINGEIRDRAIDINRLVGTGAEAHGTTTFLHVVIHVT